MARTKHTTQTKLKEKKYKFLMQGLQAIRKAQNQVENYFQSSHGKVIAEFINNFITINLHNFYFMVTKIILLQVYLQISSLSGLYGRFWINFARG